MLTSVGICSRWPATSGPPEAALEELQGDVPRGVDLEQSHGDQVVEGDLVGRLGPVAATADELEPASGVVRGDAFRKVGLEVAAQVRDRLWVVDHGEQVGQADRLSDHRACASVRRYRLRPTRVRSA